MIVTPSGALIVAIDGVDGSGKSRLAAALAERSDRRRTPGDHRARRRFSQAPGAHGARSARGSGRLLRSLLRFRRRRAPRWRPPPRRAGTAILEGVMLLRAGLPPDSWLLVLEVSAEEARRRILARDQAKGRSPEEVSRRIDCRYFPAQARYRAAHDPVGRAHAVIDNEDWRRPRLLRRAADLPRPAGGRPGRHPGGGRVTTAATSTVVLCATRDEQAGATSSIAGLTVLARALKQLGQAARHAGRAGQRRQPSRCRRRCRRTSSCAWWPIVPRRTPSGSRWARPSWGRTWSVWTASAGTGCASSTSPAAGPPRTRCTARFTAPTWASWRGGSTSRCRSGSRGTCWSERP